MDDLIVIILTLVFAAAGIFGQMKKKQAEAQSGDQPEPQPEAESGDSDSFWDFLDDDSDYTEQAPAQRTQQQPPPVQPVEKQPNYKFTAENEGASVYKHDLTSDRKVEKTEKPSRKNRFPLKKAVIYNEILNRKYT